MAHADLLAALWESVAPGTQPEGFAARRDWLLARVQPGQRVLDFGCGEGFFTGALAEHGAHPVGVDVVAEPLRRARIRHPALEFRLEPLDATLVLDDGSFDALWAGDVLEHVVDLQGTLGELRRVLPSGGRLLASTPDHPPELLRALADDASAFDAHFDPRSDHLRFFTERTLRALVEDLGFDVDELASDDGGSLLLAATRRRW